MLVQELIEAYELTDKLRYFTFTYFDISGIADIDFFRILSPQPARREELQAFHTPSYVDCLATANEYGSSDEIADDSFIEDLEQCGIGNVCLFACPCVIHVCM